MKRWIPRIALLLTAVMLLTVALQIGGNAPAVRAAVNQWGDANGDGFITVEDADLIKKFRVGLITEEELLLDFCDVDGNGVVDVYDAYLIQLYAAGIIDQFPVKKDPATNYDPEYADDPGQIQNEYLPVVYIYVPDGEWGDKKDVREGELVWMGADGVNYEFSLTIKPQGTSSLAYDKKNFTINLDGTMRIKDSWGEQSEFCLKANYIDPTHAGNVVSAQLAGQMNAEYGVLTQAVNGGSIDGVPVWVNINDEPVGLYTWCIPKSAWMFGMDEEDPEHIVMCGEGWSEGSRFVSETYVRDEDWSIEVGADEDFAYQRFDRLYAFIQSSTNNEFRENFDQYLDLDACLNYYCYVIASNAQDNTAKNMLLVTYDGLVWSPALYDLDSLWGIDSDGTGTWTDIAAGNVQLEDPLWLKLRECFGEELKARYFELRKDILSEANIWRTFETFIDSIPDPYYVYDTAMWNPDGTMIRTLELMKEQVAIYLPVVDAEVAGGDPAYVYTPEYAEDPGQTVVEYLPVIYVDVPEGTWGDKKDIREGTMLWMGADGVNYEFPISIKPQGSSSLAYDKKNFTVNLQDGSLTVKDSWGAQTEFCMKANYIDPTHAGNVVSAQLAGMMNKEYHVLDEAPNGGSIDGVPVWVVINGEPIGLYTFCIPKAAWMFGMDESNSNHFVMCGEGWSEGCLFQSESYVHDDDWSVEVGDEDLAFAAFDRLYAFIQGATNEEFRENIDQYLNLDACLNYYCYVMITDAQDNMANNMLFATYDGLVWSPVLYDLDSLWGIYWNGKETCGGGEELLEFEGEFFVKLRECFWEELQQRYFELREGVLSESNIWDTFESFIDSIPDPYYIYDTAMWNPDGTMIRTLRLMKERVAEYLPILDELMAGDDPAYIYTPEYAEDPGQTVDAYLPVVYVEVPEGPWGDKKDVREGFMYWSGPDGTNYEFPIKMKPQGSSSLAYDKKNFTVNLQSGSLTIKDSWGAQTEFCMKANYIDPTHAGNVVSAQLAGMMNAEYGVLDQAPNGGSIDGIPVWVVINGEPIGLYTFCIPKAAWMFGMDESNSNHIVMCGEGPLDGCDFISDSYIHDTEWSVEVGDEDIAFTAFDRLYDFIHSSTDEEFRENFDQYLNLDACLNYYCYTMISNGLDNMNNNMLLVTYDGLVWSPALYDLDSNWGIKWDGKEVVWERWEYVTEHYSVLWTKLRECFGDELKARYAQLRADILSEENIWATFQAFADSIPSAYYVYDTAMWNADGTMIRNLYLMRRCVAQYLPLVDEAMGYTAE